jgi:hypothetical protein
MFEKRKAVNFFRSYWEIAQELSDADRVKFYDAILKMLFTGEQSELTGMSKFAFISQKHSLTKQIQGFTDIMKRYENDLPKLAPTLVPSLPPIVPPTLQVQVKEEVYNINDKLLSEIEISDVEVSLQTYFIVAKNFQELFIRNLREKSISTVTQERAKFKNYVNPIRLMIENNECTLQDLRDVWSYLSSPKSEFWKKNILSTSKLREQIVKLIFETKKHEKDK